MSGISGVGSQAADAARNVTAAAPPPGTGAARNAAEAVPAASKTGLILDVTQIGLDIVGIFEPTPFADLANTAISLGRGDLLGAGLSVVGVVPYVGDAAKLGKLGHWAKTISNAIDLAKADPGFAKAVRPALEKVADALKAIPERAFNALPNSAKQQLSRISKQLDEALGRTAAPTSFTPSRTAPTGQVDGVPGGSRAVNPENARPDMKRGLARENQSADLLAQRGYQVVQNPQLTAADRIRHGLGPEVNPDFLIEGKIFDNFAPASQTVTGAYSGIADKVAKGQAHRIVVNLGDTTVRPGQLQQALRDNPIPGLQEVIVIDKAGAIHKTFPN